MTFSYYPQEIHLKVTKAEEGSKSVQPKIRFVFSSDVQLEVKNQVTVLKEDLLLLLL